MFTAIIIVFSALFFYRIVLYCFHLILVKTFLAEKIVYPIPKKNSSVLILIPVLREQSVILNTINHFVHMETEGINLDLLIAGTNRETSSNKKTTLVIVKEWLDEYKKYLPENIDVDYCEATDDGGDRATQLNYAVSYAKANKGIQKYDFIGVYDADSLPSEQTLKEVTWNFTNDCEIGACQQPVHFVHAANKMAKNNENPILVANALYQSTWTAIHELPMWIKYYDNHDTNKLSRRHLYLIGHGEYITEKIYNQFHFPEYEITDGIQLGYRLGMSNIRVKPLHEFCNDDVPHNLPALIKQHKRWFGGCMNLYSSYQWSKAHYHTNAILQVFDGFWSQIRWAWAVWVYLLLLGGAWFFSIRIFIVLLVMGIIYCYIFPIVAHKIMNTNIHVRYIDWFCLPIAIAVKSIGPNVYIIRKILGKRLKYEKVER